MRRREFITLIGGTTARPPVAWAQQAGMPVVGILEAGNIGANPSVIPAFRKGLSEVGYIDGQTVAIEYHAAEGYYDRLPELAADLLRRRAAVIVTPLSVAATLAAKAATTTVPIVFSTGADPVTAGLVASLNRPGGNITGVASMNTELNAKRLGLLQELLPAATRLAVLVNPAGRLAEGIVADVQAAASAMGRQVEVLTASSGRDIDMAFATMLQTRIEAVLVSPDVFLASRRAQIVVFAARHALPVIYANRDDAAAGGLMSYGSDVAEISRQLGIYTGRILKGVRPTDLPVLRAAKFELVINLNTAKALGLTVPPSILARADEVIE